MGHEIHYKMERVNPKEVDAQAVADMKEYLGDERFGILVGLSAIAKTAEDVQQLNYWCGFAGVEGRPFHAFCRTYCLEAYKAWCRSNVAGEPVDPDEDGFWGKSRETNEEFKSRASA